MITVQFVDKPLIPPTPYRNTCTSPRHNHPRTLPLSEMTKSPSNPLPLANNNPKTKHHQQPNTAFRPQPSPLVHWWNFAHQRRSSTHIRPATTVCRLSLTARTDLWATYIVRIPQTSGQPSITTFQPLFSLSTRTRHSRSRSRPPRRRQTTGRCA